MAQAAIDMILAKARGQPTEASVNRDLADIYPEPGNANERRLARGLYEFFHAQVEYTADRLEVRGPGDFDIYTEVLHAAGQDIVMTAFRNREARRYYSARARPISEVRKRWVGFVERLVSLPPRRRKQLQGRIGKLEPNTRLGKSLVKAGEPGDINEWRLRNGQSELGVVVEIERAQDIADFLQPAMVRAAVRTGRGTAARLGFASFALTDQDALDWIRGYTFSLSQRTAHGFENQVKREVIRRIDEGLGGRELTRRLREYIDPTTADGRSKPGNRIRYEADRIARTETHRAHHMGVVEAAAEEGIQWFRWVTAGTNIRTGTEVCWRCAPMEGKLIPIEEVRIGVVKEYPGLIPVHPNCRCKLVPVQHPEGLPSEDFMDADQIARFRQSVADNDTGLHPFAEQAREVKGITDEQDKRRGRLATINRKMTTRGGAVGEERKALMAERRQLKAESRRHLERRLEQFREQRGQVRETVREAWRVRHA